MKKTLFLIAFAIVFVAIVPSKVEAGCLVFCKKKKVTEVTKIVIGSNVNSPNSTVVNNTGTPVVVANHTPSYDYDNDYRTLGASCYSNPTTGDVGDTIHWRASVYGGNGDYNVTWSGTNGLDGDGTSITKRYNSPGTKNASIRVRSGSQTLTRNCNSVIIYDYDNRYNDRDDDYYDYDDDYYRNRPLLVSCSVNSTFAQIGSSVTWQTYVSGGNGSYRYTWDGSDYLRGSSRNVSVSYNSNGVKTASVTVRSDGQSVTQSCSNSITVGTANNQSNNNSGLQTACYPDKTTARIGTPVTWYAEAVGGSGNYTYAWSGSDALYGSQASTIKTYGSAGTKVGSVTITASNGQSTVQSCSGSVYIQGDTVVRAAPANTDNNSNNGALTAASLFSLSNVPWGWVVVLVIMLLVATIIYLVINKNKI